MNMFVVALSAILITIALITIRLFLGPTVYDRLLAANALGTKVVLLICTFGFLTGRPDFLDLALIYVLINLTSTLAVVKFFEFDYKSSSSKHLKNSG